MTETDIVNGALLALGEPKITDLATSQQPIADTCRQLYAPTRDSLLRMYPWNFARTRDSLIAAAAPITAVSNAAGQLRLATATTRAVGAHIYIPTLGRRKVTAAGAGWIEAGPFTAVSGIAVWYASPAFGHSYQIALPADCLRVLEVNGYQSSTKGASFELEGRSLLLSSAKADVRYMRKVADPDEWDSHFVFCAHYYLACKLAAKLTQSSSRTEDMMRLFQDAVSEARASNAFETASWVIPADQDEDNDNPRTYGNGW